MITVKFVGWVPGLQKVALVKAVAEALVLEARSLGAIAQIEYEVVCCEDTPCPKAAKTCHPEGPSRHALYSR